MTDKELLGRAAKALRIDYRHVYDEPGGQYLWDGTKLVAWNPLTDDGDALRLAVKLKMDVDITGDTAWAMAEQDTHAGHAEPLGLDNAAATRRAIVRAAAAIAQP